MKLYLWSNKTKLTMKLPKPQKNSRGFTLIETLVYLALFAIIMTGVVSVSYAMFESSGRNQTKTLVQEEGDFLLAKINWAMNSATSISVQPSPPVLTITRSANPNLIVLDAASNNLRIAKNGGMAEILNNSIVALSNVVITHIGSGTAVEGIIFSFTLTAKTPNGQNFSQNFTTTKYIRK